MADKEKIIERIKKLDDEQALQNLEQWLDSIEKAESKEAGAGPALTGNPAFKPKSPAEKESDAMFTQGEIKGGDKG